MSQRPQMASYQSKIASECRLYLRILTKLSFRGNGLDFAGVYTTLCQPTSMLHFNTHLEHPQGNLDGSMSLEIKHAIFSNNVLKIKNGIF